MAFVISFSSTGFEIARERPNPINPIAGESVPDWLRSELLQANDDPLCALIERLVQPGQGHRDITVERGRGVCERPTLDASTGSDSMPITPYLYYEDVVSATKFLAEAFGFRRFGAVSRGPDGKINHAAMKVGSNVVMMGRPPRAYRNPKRLGQATQCLLVDVRGVDAHFERAIKAGARVLQEPADTPFGTRRYGVTDPEGHEWYFSQRRRSKGAASRQRR